mgnify:CR=1 FL=1
MAINIGSILGFFICGYLGENIGWHYGFAAAGIGMAFGLGQFILTRERLGNAGALPQEVISDKIKKRDLNKPLICLASSYEMISEYVDFMPNFDFTGLSKERPTTFIFDSPKGISNHITKYSKSVGFRVPNNDFCKKLINEFGKPIVNCLPSLS